MKKIIILSITLLLAGCSYPVSNPTLRPGDVVMIEGLTFSDGEYTIESVTQDQMGFRIQGWTTYLKTDDYVIHIVRRAPIQKK